jgi:hypothetical protein
MNTMLPWNFYLLLIDNTNMACVLSSEVETPASINVGSFESSGKYATFMKRISRKMENNMTKAPHIFLS